MNLTTTLSTRTGIGTVGGAVAGFAVLIAGSQFSDWPIEAVVTAASLPFTVSAGLIVEGLRARRGPEHGERLEFPKPLGNAESDSMTLGLVPRYGTICLIEIVRSWQPPQVLHLFVPFLNGFGDQDVIGPMVEHVLDNGGQLRVVSIDAESNAAQVRASLLASTKSTYTKESYSLSLQAFHKHIQALENRFPGQVSLSLLDQPLDSAGYFLATKDGELLAGWTCTLTSLPLLRESHLYLPASPELRRRFAVFEEKYGQHFKTKDKQSQLESNSQSRVAELAAKFSTTSF